MRLGQEAIELFFTAAEVDGLAGAIVVISRPRSALLAISESSSKMPIVRWAVVM